MKMRQIGMKAKFIRYLKSMRVFLLFILFLFVFRGAVADWNPVPTGSMKPTILEGDVIWVNKLAYDVRLPFTSIVLSKYAAPQRGDIVVFDSHAAEKRMVKRVIGLPGDRVEMVDNKLFINGDQVNYKPAHPLIRAEDREDGRYYLEQTNTLEHWVQFKPGWSPLASMEPMTVPDGYYLVLGDNRDNSADSRVYGLVPEIEIEGRAERVLLSANLNNHWIPRAERLFKSLYE
jgi:signal peptidase I